jgi:hypothetical protein
MKSQRAFLGTLFMLIIAAGAPPSLQAQVGCEDCLQLYDDEGKHRGFACLNEGTEVLECRATTTSCGGWTCEPTFAFDDAGVAVGFMLCGGEFRRMVDLEPIHLATVHAHVPLAVLRGLEISAG